MPSSSQNVSPSGLFIIYCGWADPVENTNQWIDSVESSAGRGQTKTIDLSSYKPNYIKFVSTNGFGFEKGYIDFECVTSVLPD